MTDEQKNTLDRVKREAAVSLIASLAKAMGAVVVFYNPECGEFALKMDPRAVEFFGHESLVDALGGVS